ncbi:MAG: alkaline phosphatase [Bacteroidales bacterium]|nr:alkaline phosphatase [Bacteroidales bacterium]
MKKYLFLLLLAIVAVACQTEKKYPCPKHIVIIGLDGMSSESLRGTTIMPFYRSLMAKGSWALHKRSVLPSASALNWASLYMGAGPEQHGYNTWGSKHPDFPSDTLTEHGFFPDIYYQTKLKMPEAKIAHFYEWSGMHYVVDTLSIDKDMQINHREGGLEKALDYITTEKPLISSIIFDSPDHEGHAFGWMSDEYLAVENHLDSCIHQIYDSIEKAGMTDETLFILTADHGGINKGHGSITMNEMEAPVVFVGKGIKQNYEINCPVSICDVIPTVAVMLGVDRPHAWVGKPLYNIFE